MLVPGRSYNSASAASQTPRTCQQHAIKSTVQCRRLLDQAGRRGHHGRPALQLMRTKPHASNSNALLWLYTLYNSKDMLLSNCDAAYAARCSRAKANDAAWQGALTN